MTPSRLARAAALGLALLPVACAAPAPGPRTATFDCILAGGRVVQDGAPGELLEQPPLDAHDERHRDEHRRQHQRDADHRPRHLAHRR